jgi:hypothetical protein
MTDREEALGSLGKALALLAARMTGNPDHGIHIHAGEQLARMRMELEGPRLSPIRERGWVDIGLMAAKELEGVDPEFANALMDADYDFKHAE